MIKQFTDVDIERISAILGKPSAKQENAFSWKIKNDETHQTLVFTIYTNVPLADSGEMTNIISVQNNQGYFELHSCTDYLLFEPDEVIFIEASEEYLSSLVIGQTGTVSMFSNIRRSLLHEDITSLDAPLLLSAMQLALADSML